MDSDDDNDGVDDYDRGLPLDNCRTNRQHRPSNNDGDLAGDPCDADDDNDGTEDEDGASR